MATKFVVLGLNDDGDGSYVVKIFDNEKDADERANKLEELVNIYPEAETAENEDKILELDPKWNGETTTYSVEKADY